MYTRINSSPSTTGRYIHRVGGRRGESRCEEVEAMMRNDDDGKRWKIGSQKNEQDDGLWNLRTAFLFFFFFFPLSVSLSFFLFLSFPFQLSFFAMPLTARSDTFFMSRPRPLCVHIRCVIPKNIILTHDRTIKKSYLSFDFVDVFFFFFKKKRTTYSETFENPLENCSSF